MFETVLLKNGTVSKKNPSNELYPLDHSLTAISDKPEANL
jgi:hypothetical protein